MCRCGRDRVNADTHASALLSLPARYGAPMPSERVLRTIAGVLALAGIGVALYIAIVESGGGSPQCLAGGHGCETVAKSHYSHIAGINVAVFGIVGYVLLVVAALLPGDVARIGGLRRSPWSASASAST